MNTNLAKLIPFQQESTIDQGSKTKKQNNRLKPQANHTSVDPIKTTEHINQIIQYYLSHKDTKNHIWIRNAMLFIVGCNFSFRVSDLCRLQAKHILNPDNTFKSHVIIKAKKTGKTHKIAINQAVRNIVTKYYNTVGSWPQQTDYLFSSTRGNHITEDAVQKLMKSTERELHLPYNMGSHSMRKSFGYWVIQNNKTSPQVLIDLQDMYGHSNQRDTLRYIGLEQETKDEIVMNLDMGINSENFGGDI